MSVVGLYSIDGDDWYGTYGWAVAKGGSDDFLKPWDRKTPMQHDWADQHGTDVDTANVFFKAKEISVPGALIAANEADFWLKYNAFFKKLAEPGTRRIYINELGRSFYVYYDSCTSFTRLTRIKTNLGNKVACKFTLKFIEPVPSFWKQFTYLVDKDGRKLITNTNNKILIPPTK